MADKKYTAEIWVDDQIRQVEVTVELISWLDVDDYLQDYRIKGRAIIKVPPEAIPGGGTYQALVAWGIPPGDSFPETVAIFWDRPSNRFVKVNL